jgi:hypothetical protein
MNTSHESGEEARRRLPHEPSPFRRELTSVGVGQATWLVPEGDLTVAGQRRLWAGLRWLYTGREYVYPTSRRYWRRPAGAGGLRVAGNSGEGPMSWPLVDESLDAWLSSLSAHDARAVRRTVDTAGA